MSGFLVDTNVISKILRATPNPQVAAWSQRMPKEGLFLSVISMREFRKGVTIMPPGGRRAQLEKSTEEQVPVWFGSACR